MSGPLLRRFLGVSTFVTLAVAGAAATWDRYRVMVPDEAAAQRLLDSGLTIYECGLHRGANDVAIRPGEFFDLVALGLPYVRVGTIVAPEMGGRIRTQTGDYRSTWYTMDEILAYYEQVRQANPAMVSRRSIGTSVNGETIWAYRVQAVPDAFQVLRGGTPGVAPPITPAKNFVFLFGIHAREWISPSSGMHVLNRLVSDLKNPASFIRQRSVGRAVYWLVPSLNPDGYRFTWASSNNRLWRKNRRNNGNGTFGVDLNRNFNPGWGLGSSGNTNSETYRGPSVYSEPETRALRDLGASLTNVAGYIDFHSYSQLVLWAWGYTTSASPDAALLSSVGQTMEQQIELLYNNPYRIGQASTTLYVAGGVTSDHFSQVHRTASYTIELRDTGQFGFVLPTSQITPTQDEAWAGVVGLLQRRL